MDRSVQGEPDRVAGAGRIFVGISIPEEVRRSLEAHLRQALGGHPLPGRPVPPANWHLTLRFLGDTSAAELERVRAELADRALGTRFSIGFSRCGAFPRPARATVLWLGIGQGAASLAALAAAVESAVRRIGRPAESRAFSPHLTLSRLQPPRDVRPLLATLPHFSEQFEVAGFALFRSFLGHGPARYVALDRFALETPFHGPSTY